MFITNYNQTITATTIGGKKGKPKINTFHNSNQHQILHLDISSFSMIMKFKTRCEITDSQQTQVSVNPEYWIISSHQDQWENKVKGKKRYFKLISRLNCHKISIDRKLHIICPSACTTFIWRIKRDVILNKLSHNPFHFHNADCVYCIENISTLKAIPWKTLARTLAQYKLRVL